MQLKIKDLLRAIESMSNLSETQSPKLKIQPSFWLSRQIKKVTGEIENYELARSLLVRQFGAPKHEGSNEYSVLPENEDKFFEQLSELQNSVVEINIERRAVVYINQPEYSAIELANMWFLWTDEEPPAPMPVVNVIVPETTAAA